MDQLVTCVLTQNYLHVSASRLQPLRKQLLGLRLPDVLPQLKWNRKRIADRVTESMVAGAAKCQQEGLSLDRTVVAAIDVQPNAAVYSRNLKLFGRGRYGATPHPTTTLVRFTFSEAPDAPSGRVGKLEEVRALLRNQQRPFVDTISDAVSKRAALRGADKPVFK